MGGLFHGNQPLTTTDYSGLQVQTTSGALPVPIVYGQNMLSPNCVWYNNFQQHPSNGKGGSKGGGGGKGAQQTYVYSCSIILALCEGPIANGPNGGLGTILNGSPPGFAFSALNAELFTGTTPQTPWSYTTADYPSQALGYPGIAYFASSTFWLGSSASVGSYNIEVYGILHGTGFNGVDADPSQVIYDFLTNAQYGVGFPAAAINGAALYGNNSASYQAYCFATGLAISPVMTNQEMASSVITRWLQLTNSTAVWSGGQLKFVPYGDASTTANGWTYTPDVTPIYALTDEDFVHSQGEDPVKITRKDPFSLPNWLSVETTARSDFYNTGPISVWDQNAIDEFGLRVGSTVTAHEICDPGIAQTAVQLILQRELYIRRTFEFKLSAEFCLLDPMDLVALTDPLIGLNGTVVRITDIEEDDSGILSVTAEEFPQGVATAVQYPTQAKSNGFPVNTVTPNAVNTPLIIEPPPGLTNNVEQIWIGVSPQGGDPNWGGCIVNASVDGVTYDVVTTIYGPSAQGVLTTALGAYSGANPDSVDTLSLDLTECLGSLASTTAPTAAAGAANMAYVNGEFLTFATATLTAANKYNLTGLYRGLAGSVAGAQAIGAGFTLLGANILKYDIPTAEIGQSIYFKFQSFNIFGAGAQDLSACAEYAYVVNGAGSLGPVAAALSVGTAMDYGNVESSVSESDDWGNVSGAVIATIDLGNVTS